MKKITLAVLALVVIASLLLAACGSGTTTTITNTTTTTSNIPTTITNTTTTTSNVTTTAKSNKPSVVRIGILLDMSGPYAGILAPWVDSITAVQQYINTELGGIDGIPLDFEYRNYGGNTNTGIAMYNDLLAMNPRPWIIMVPDTNLSVVLKDRAVQDNIILQSTGTTASLYPAANSFAYCPSYEDFAGGFIDWLAKNHPGDKMAFLTWDSAYGRGPTTPAVYAYAQQKGVSIVDTEYFPVTAVDVTAQLSKIRTAGATWVYTNTTGAGPAAIIKGAKDIGFKFNLVGNMGIDQTMIPTVSAADAEGVMSLLQYEPLTATSMPGVSKMNEYFARYGRPASSGAAFPYMFSYALTADQVITQAAAAVGWDKLDNAAIKAQFLKLNDFKPLGGIEHITYTDSRRSNTQALMGQFQNGKLNAIGDFFQLPDLTGRQ